MRDPIGPQHPHADEHRRPQRRRASTIVTHTGASVAAVVAGGATITAAPIRLPAIHVMQSTTARGLTDADAAPGRDRRASGETWAPGMMRPDYRRTSAELRPAARRLSRRGVTSPRRPARVGCDGPRAASRAAPTGGPCGARTGRRRADRAASVRSSSQTCARPYWYVSVDDAGSAQPDREHCRLHAAQSMRRIAASGWWMHLRAERNCRRDRTRSIWLMSNLPPPPPPPPPGRSGGRGQQNDQQPPERGGRRPIGSRTGRAGSSRCSSPSLLLSFAAAHACGRPRAPTR